MRTCIIASPVATQSGYGHHAREVVTNIIEQKGNEWDIKLLSMPWGSTPMSFPLSQEIASRIIPLPIQQQPDIWVQISVPNEFQPVGKYNIGITAVTEGDICPKEWIESINKMQLTIVPSVFAKNVLEKTAQTNNLTITTNIKVISEYFDDSIYCKPTGSLSILNDIHEQYCYLFVGHWLQGSLGEDRKNITGLIHTFLETFKNKPNPPALILKTSGATYSVTDRFRIEKQINQLRNLHSSNKLPNIYLLHGDLSDEEMNQLYNHQKVKAMVSFTKGEGFGRPLLEFTTTGKPLIVPHYSGQVDFLLKDSIIEIPGGLTEIHPSARNQFLIEGAKWFTPDYAYAKKVFRETFKHYNKFVTIGRKQKKHVYENFTKQAIKKQYTEVLSLIESNTSEIPNTQELQLPKLKLPKLKTV
jgi:glycosyltransferase involved in cell wall biosynthesis